MNTKIKMLLVLMVIMSFLVACSSECECGCAECDETSADNGISQDSWSSPETITRAFMAAAVAKDCEKLASYSSPDGTEALDNFCKNPEKPVFHVGSARIDQVLIRDWTSPSQKEITCVGEMLFQFSSGSSNYEDDWKLWVENLSGKWYVFAFNPYR